jgi:hypothetical protein
MGQEIAAPKRSGLAVLLDVIVAPRSAFESLREQPQWFVAFVVVSILGLIGGLLLLPANEHVMSGVFAQQMQTNPQLATMTPEKQQQVLGYQMLAIHWGWVGAPLFVLIGTLVGSLLLFIAGKIVGSPAGFSRFFALEMNIGLVGFGFSYLLLGILAQLRGPDSFGSQHELMGSIPSLGMLASGKLGAFLGTFNPIYIWNAALLGLGLQGVAGFKPRSAWITAVVLFLIGACFAVVGASFEK